MKTKPFPRAYGSFKAFRIRFRVGGLGLRAKASRRESSAATSAARFRFTT